MNSNLSKKKKKKSLLLSVRVMGARAEGRWAAGQLAPSFSRDPALVTVTYRG